MCFIQNDQLLECSCKDKEWERDVSDPGLVTNQHTSQSKFHTERSIKLKPILLDSFMLLYRSSQSAGVFFVFF